MSPLWFKKLSLTAGLRFDEQSFDYTDVWDENRIKSKSYSRFTPRFSLVYALSRNFYLKAIAGRAFRLPSFSEVFAANTFAIASNINQLSPETVTTYELAADWKIRPQITWRGNIFYTDFQNLVAYSNSNNALATNVYSQRTGGFETEIDWQFGNFSGFMNAHFVKLFGEEVLDKTVSEMTTLTWIPAHVLKAGVVYQREKWYASLNGMYQGEVKRRDSDRLPVSYNGREVQTSDYRPANVPAWFSLNARLSYRAFTNVEFSVQANHALNTERYLLKTLSYPFDYQASKRMLLLEVRMTY
jgi:iron complex outermembrane receptor protein